MGGANLWNTYGKKINVQQKNVHRALELIFNSISYLIVWLFDWLFFNFFFLQNYVLYAIQSLIVQFWTKMFVYDFFFDIFATMVFWVLVKVNYDLISERIPGNHQNNFRQMFWVILKILFALDLQLFHKQVFMFQYLSLTGKQFVVDKSNLKTFDFMIYVRPMQNGLGNLWIAYWAYILIATHSFALVIGAIIRAMFQ